MRWAGLFIAAVACSGSSPAGPSPRLPVRRHPQLAAPAPDAAIDASGPSGRGGACSRDGRTCADGLACLPLPGGSCGSRCGVTGSPCDGACVETARAGELCLESCASDRDCRTDEGYVCDPQWKACLVPNFAAIVPRQCPATGPERDAAFGPAEPWSASAPGLYQLEPSAVVADDGGAVAMYITRAAITEGNVLAVSRPGATGAAFTSDRQSHFDPWLARDRAGKLYAVWLGFDGRGANSEIGMATSSDRGATWSAPVAAHDPADCAGDEEDCLDKPMIAVGPDARVPGREVLYVMYGGADALRVRASRDGGKTFAPAVTALAGIYGNPAIGGDGRLHLVTLNGGPPDAFGSAQQKIEYTVSADGGASFATPITDSGRDEVLPFFFANPSIAVDDLRHWLYVAYVRGGRDAVWDVVIAASRDGGKTWTRTRLGDGCAIHMVPNLALDPTTGMLHVAWYDSEGAPGRFAHTTCAPGAANCTQQGAINSEPFAALSTVRHGAKWVGEYESLVVDDKRRVLHAVWAQPVDDGGKVVARIFHATAKLPRR